MQMIARMRQRSSRAFRATKLICWADDRIPLFKGFLGSLPMEVEGVRAGAFANCCQSKKEVIQCGCKHSRKISPTREGKEGGWLPGGDILSALHQGDRERASTLLPIFCQDQSFLTSSDFIDVLNYCAHAPDPLFALEILKFSDAKGLVMNKNGYIFVVQALSRGGYLQEAFDLLFHLVVNESVDPVLPFFNIFLNGCASARNPDFARECLELMKSKHVGKSEITFRELLKLASWRRDIYAVHELWKECFEIYCPSLTSLQSFARCFARLGELQFACNILQHMVTVALQQNVLVKVCSGKQFKESKVDIPIPLDTHISFNETPYLLVKNELNLARNAGFLDMENRLPCDIVLSGASALRCRRDVAYLLKNFASKSVLKLLRFSFNDVIHACAHFKNFEMVEQLVQQMRTLGLQPSLCTYDGLVKAVLVEKADCCQGFWLRHT